MPVLIADGQQPPNGSGPPGVFGASSHDGASPSPLLLLSARVVASLLLEDSLAASLLLLGALLPAVLASSLLALASTSALVSELLTVQPMSSTPRKARRPARSGMPDSPHRRRICPEVRIVIRRTVCSPARSAADHALERDVELAANHADDA